LGHRGLILSFLPGDSFYAFCFQILTGVDNIDNLSFSCLNAFYLKTNQLRP